MTNIRNSSFLVLGQRKGEQSGYWGMLVFGHAELAPGCKSFPKRDVPVIGGKKNERTSDMLGLKFLKREVMWLLDYIWCWDMHIQFQEIRFFPKSDTPRNWRANWHQDWQLIVPGNIRKGDQTLNWIMLQGWITQIQLQMAGTSKMWCTWYCRLDQSQDWLLSGHLPSEKELEWLIHYVGGPGAFIFSF